MILRHLRKNETGMLLLEVMLATAIFAMVALSLAVALQATIDAFLNIRRESQIRIALQSELAETTSQRLVINREEVPLPNLTEVTCLREVKELARLNQDKENVTGLYEVNLTANWVENGQKMEREVQEYVYQAP